MRVCGLRSVQAWPSGCLPSKRTPMPSSRELPCSALLWSRSCSLREKNARHWSGNVTIVSTDMRKWNPPQSDYVCTRSSCNTASSPCKADILVSELLGSFGDNELSPECLDGAQTFLKRTCDSAVCRRCPSHRLAESGISIPSKYGPHRARCHSSLAGTPRLSRPSPRASCTAS